MMFIDNGALATDVTQCPHQPSTDLWRLWQQQFAAQAFTPAREVAIRKGTEDRLATAGLRLGKPGGIAADVLARSALPKDEDAWEELRRVLADWDPNERVERNPQ